MAQFAHIVLLIASLLACPVNCMGALECDAPQDTISAGCACCHDPASALGAPLSPDEPLPDDECECGNCLCHGAVLSDHNGLLSDGLVVAAIIQPAPAQAAALEFSSSLPWSADGDDSPSGVSGRFLRILHESFLI
jgi:hypothetical protein